MLPGAGVERRASSSSSGLAIHRCPADCFLQAAAAAAVVVVVDVHMQISFITLDKFDRSSQFQRRLQTCCGHQSCLRLEERESSQPQGNKPMHGCTAHSQWKQWSRVRRVPNGHTHTHTRLRWWRQPACQACPTTSTE